MKRNIYNLLTFIDVMINKKVYLRLARASGFVVDDQTTAKQLYLLYRQEPNEPIA